MTKKEFIEKFGEFQINNSTTEEIIEQFANTPSKTMEYLPIFFMEAKVYNHGIINEDINSFETNWEQLAQDIAIANGIESKLADFYFSSETDAPYKAFVLPNFDPKDNFLISLFKKLGLTFSNEGEETFTNPKFSIIDVKNIDKSKSVLLVNEPFEEYYEDVDTFNEIDKFMHENLKNIKRISMNITFEYNGAMPTFYVGTTESNNLVGIFSYGVYT